MSEITEVLSICLDPRFALIVFAGSAAGLFVGAIPGLSVSMATALLVSITYSWQTGDALALIMGVYVVGVFSGAISAILINIPGAPSSVVTTLDGFPMARQGRGITALRYAAVYSFIGTLFGMLCLWVLARPVSALALRFSPIDYFLLGVLGLVTVGCLTSSNRVKGFVSALAGLVISVVGLDAVTGTARLTMGVYDLQAGVNIVPALVGLFGFAELLWLVGQGGLSGKTAEFSEKMPEPLHKIFSHWLPSLWYSTIGMLVGALPGAGGPVASFLAYGAAKKATKSPSIPFGEGAAEGLVASEAANNACIGGALIPMLTLGVPGDAVTAIILSVFLVHGLQPGPMFIQSSPQMFRVILAGGILASGFILLLGLCVAPRLGRLLSVRRGLLLPVVAALCAVGAFACNNRSFDLLVMLFFGVLGYVMRRRDYPVAPMTLALVLGGMMDMNFRRAISLASSDERFLQALLGRPITVVLLLVTALILSGAMLSAYTARRRARQ